MRALIAHRFADEIIFRLGGGIHGIAETKIYFVSNRSGTKEIWQMDYDGANQKQLTHTGLDRACRRTCRPTARAWHSPA